MDHILPADILRKWLSVAYSRAGTQLSPPPAPSGRGSFSGVISPKRIGWQTALGLALILACLACEVALLRLGIDDLDEGYFAQQALRVLHGQLPYRDFQTLYTPGLAYLHAALFGLVGGPFLLVPRALSLAARAGLALILFVMARPLVRQPLWAAMPSLFLLVGLDDAPVLWEPHPGWLSTLLAILAAWCLSHRPTRRWLATAGVCAGAAYLFKQNTGAYILAAIIAGRLAAAWSPTSRWANRHPHGLNALPTQDFAASAPLGPIAVVVASFVGFTVLWLGPLLVALDGDVSQLGVLIGAINPASLFYGPELPIVVPLLCLVGGIWVAWRERDPRIRWYLLSGGALFLTQYPRMDALHVAWSAPLLLVSGAVALDRLRPVIAGAVLLAAFVLVGPTVTSRLAAVQHPAVPIEEIQYAAGFEVPGPTRADLQGVVAEIQARTQPNEAIFVYPTEPLLYVLAERRNPTRFDHLNPGAADPRQIAQIIADLEAANVRLVVVSDYWLGYWGPPGPNAPIEAWLASRFKEAARFGAYRVLVAAL